MILTKLTATLVMLSMLSGCSYILMDDPPLEEVWHSLPKGQYIPCDSGTGPAVVDSILVASSAGTGVVAILLNQDGLSHVLLGSAVVSALITGLSASHGFGTASDCKRFQLRDLQENTSKSNSKPLRYQTDWPE
jgi:hypothetical protein